MRLRPRPVRPFLGPLDTSAVTWRGRAVRYVLIYLSLVLALVAARTLTAQVRPELLAAQALEAELGMRRDALSAEVEALLSTARVRAWARQSGMRPYAEAPKELQEIPPPEPDPPAPSPGPTPAGQAPPSQTSSDQTATEQTPPTRPLEVTTQWR